MWGFFGSLSMKLFFYSGKKTRLFLEGVLLSLPPKKEFYVWSKMKSPKWKLLAEYIYYSTLSPRKTEAGALSLFSEVAHRTAQSVLVVC